MPITSNPSEVWGPRGRGFNMAVAQSGGVLVHFTGQVAWDANEQIVGKDDIEAQTRQCFENIRIVLASVGGTFGDVVSVTTYFTSRAQLPVIQKVRNDYFDQASSPASTSVMVAGLGHPDFLVELTPVAIIPEDRFVAPSMER